MGRERNWTSEEREYLEDNWGRVSMQTLVKKLNRSENAIKIKVFRWNLGPFLDNGDYVTCNQLSLALGYGTWCGYRAKSWVENRDFPIRTRRVNNNTFKIVYLDQFWKWAEKNQHHLDFACFEENALGKEPAWAKAKRRRDIQRAWRISLEPWSKSEDDRLRQLLKKQRHSWKELSDMLGRTEGAIQRRICDLGIKDRPVRKSPHSPWTQQQFDYVALMINDGCNYEEMSDVLGKSTKAIRGRVYQMYLTENLDKVRAYIKGGKWGDGRPERQIKQHLQMSMEEKSTTRGELMRLISLLEQRAQIMSQTEEPFKDFWQKELCALWDPTKGCTAGESDCDACWAFQRKQINE